MQDYVVVIVALIFTGSFAFLTPVSNNATAVPFDIVGKAYVFGPISGISQDESGLTEWVLAGDWRSSLPNSTDILNNNTNGTTFNAAIEMVRLDGTARHTHTLTDFVLLNSSSESSTNSTIFNGTSTISLADGPAVDIPTSVKMSNNNVITIWLDPESSDSHFGTSPMIFGVVANPDLDNSTAQESVSMTNATQNNAFSH